MTKPAPTLTDAAGSGGVIAQDGFDYQLWYGAIRAAAWLADPTFEGMIFEGLEDIEARFFAPQTPAGHVLERIQAKSGALSPADVAAVLDNFLTFEAHFPGATRGFTLVTPSLPPTLRFITRDLARVRQAYGFYRPLRQIADASDRKLLADLEGALGMERARLLFARGDIDLRALTSVAEARGAFGIALSEAFGLDLMQSRLAGAFNAIATLGQGNRGRLLARTELLDAAESALNTPLAQRRRANLHILGDRPTTTPAGAVILDFSAFADSPGRYAAADAWTEGVLGPLRKVADWMQSNGLARARLSGAYRLTTALLIGATLRSARGLELDLETKSGDWATDDHPRRGTPKLSLSIRPAARLEGGVLRLCVGVLRSPEPVLQASGADPATFSVIELADAIATADELQALVRSIKTFVDAELTRHRPTEIDLYLVGPAALAAALGHRWNGMPPTQLYEFDAEHQTYRPTARIDR